MTRIDRFRFAAFSLSALLATLAAPRPASAEADRGWQVTLAPYAWGASLEGSAALRGREAEVDLTASDILEDLEIGFMGLAVARKGDWGLVGDLFHVGIGEEAPMPPADVDISLSLVTLEGLRRLSGTVDLTFGARWNQVEGGISLEGPIAFELERTRDWVDPVVGIVLHTPGDRRWHATLIADVGGFGVGSDLTWQVFPSAGYRFSERASIEVGWRFLDTDYEDGSGADLFAYDMQLQGPAVGLTFTF